MIRSVAAIAKTPSAKVSSRVVGTRFSLPGVADAAIRTVWLDNPPLNVIGSEIAEMLARALDEIDDETCVIVLRGKGDRAFSAGADISGFKDSDGGARRLQQLADRRFLFINIGLLACIAFVPFPTHLVPSTSVTTACGQRP